MKHDKKTLEMTLRGIEGKRNQESFPGMIAGAYALWLAREEKSVDIPDLETILNDFEPDIDIHRFIKGELGDHWDKYHPFIMRFDQALLKKVILELAPQGGRSDFSHTPSEVLELVTRLLEIAPDDHVADFGRWCGRILVPRVQ